MAQLAHEAAWGRSPVLEWMGRREGFLHGLHARRRVEDAQRGPAATCRGRFARAAPARWWRRNDIARLPELSSALAVHAPQMECELNRIFRAICAFYSSSLAGRVDEESEPLGSRWRP